MSGIHGRERDEIDRFQVISDVPDKSFVIDSLISGKGNAGLIVRVAELYADIILNRPHRVMHSDFDCMVSGKFVPFFTSDDFSYLYGRICGQVP